MAAIFIVAVLFRPTQYQWILLAKSAGNASSRSTAWTLLIQRQPHRGSFRLPRKRGAKISRALSSIFWSRPNICRPHLLQCSKAVTSCFARTPRLVFIAFHLLYYSPSMTAFHVVHIINSNVGPYFSILKLLLMYLKKRFLLIFQTSFFWS